MRLFRLTLATGLVLTMALACTTSDGEATDDVESTTTIEAVATSTAGTSTPTEMPPGFYFNGEFIALGEFDPDSPVELINMCDDLPDEVLHAAGMQRVEASEALFTGGRLICVFLPLDNKADSGTQGFMADSIPLSRFHELDYVLSENVSPTIPGVFTHVLDTANERECWASVSTERGRIGFDYKSYDSNLTFQDICGRAVQTLETVYEQLQEQN